MYIINRIKETLTDRVIKCLEEMTNIRCIHSITLKESPNSSYSLTLVIRLERESSEDEIVEEHLYVFSDTENTLRITPSAKTSAEIRKEDLPFSREHLLEYVLDGVVCSPSYCIVSRPVIWDGTDEDS
jgi:hypothetical protein